MSVATIYPTADGFLNNISGWYSGEGFNLSRSSSSSDADYAEAYLKFTTVGAGIGASDTINSVTFRWNIYNWTDVNAVGFWGFYTDINNVWDNAGTWGEPTPPYVPLGPGYGTVSDGEVTLGGTGWNAQALTNLIPKSALFGVCIKALLGDLGPAAMYFYDKDGGANSPYIEINFTPASSPSVSSWSQPLSRPYVSKTEIIPY